MNNLLTCAQVDTYVIISPTTSLEAPMHSCVMQVTVVVVHVMGDRSYDWCMWLYMLICILCMDDVTGAN